MADEPRRPDRNKSAAPGAADMMGAGVQMAASIVLFLFVGRWLDARLGTSPWLLMLGVFVGFGASFYSMYRKLMGGSGKPTDKGK